MKIGSNQQLISSSMVDTPLRKQWLLRIWGLFLGVESLILGAVYYSRNLSRSGFPGSAIEILDFSLLIISVMGVFIGSSLALGNRVSEMVALQARRILSEDKWWSGLLILSLVAGYESFQDILFLGADIEPVHYQGYRIFLSDHFSLLVILSLLSAQSIVSLLVFRWGTIRDFLRQPVPKAILVGFSLGAVVLMAISFSGYGNLVTSIYLPGFAVMGLAPILGIQVLILMEVVMVLILIVGWLLHRIGPIKALKKDWILMLGIGLLAFTSWISVPLSASSFTDTPRAPNYEFYPTSDALQYSQSAYQILVGNGIRTTSHAGFQIMLAIIHAIIGNSPVKTITFQIGLLSLTPILLYWLISLIHHRISAVLVSMLLIIKVRNGLLLKQQICYSSVADLMTESYGTLFAILVAVLFTQWMFKPQDKKPYTLLLGAVIGWCILTRVDMFIMLPVIGLLLVLYFWRRPAFWIRSIGYLALGLFLILGPTLISQFTVTRSPYVILFGKGDYLRNAGKIYDSEVDGSGNVQKLSRAGYFFVHVENSLEQLLLFLPSNHQPLLTLSSLPDMFSRKAQTLDQENNTFPERYLERYVRSLPYWWPDRWDRTLAARSILPAVGSMLLIGIGMSQLRGKKSWIKWALILFALSHICIYAFIGASGGRWVESIDWVPLVFYGLGLSWLLFRILDWTGYTGWDPWWTNAGPPPDQTQVLPLKVDSHFWVHAGLILLLGLGMVAADRWIPQRYTDETLDQLLSGIDFKDYQGVNVEELQAKDPDLQLWYGLAIHPRFFAAGDRMEDDRSGTIPDYSFNRIEFFLVGTEDVWVAYPSMAGGEVIPSGAEVLIIGRHEPGIYNSAGKPISGQYIRAIRILPVDDPD